MNGPDLVVAMSSGPHPSPAEERLVEDARRAIRESAQRPREIEVGIALSIALGKERPAVACGGCQTPLEVEGVPARTNVRLRAPFRLIFEEPPAAEPAH